jgi:NADH-quinone oxidoreductase subunit G
LPYDTLSTMRGRMTAIAPHFAAVGDIMPASWVAPKASPGHFYINAAPFDEFVTNFYMTDPISRASKTMAECTRVILGPQIKKVA